MYVSGITKRVLEAFICASSLISSDPSVPTLSSVGKSGHTLTLHRVDVPAHSLIPLLTRLPVLKSVTLPFPSLPGLYLLQNALVFQDRTHTTTS